MAAATIHPDFDLTKLTENPDNPRVLSRDGEKKLAASLDEFGMVETIVANRRKDGTLMVLGGHQRLKVLLKKGAKRGPVSIVEVDELQEKKLNLLLNGHHGTWDGDKLAEILGELGDADVDLGGLGLDGIPAFEAIMVDLKDAEEADAGPGGEEGESREVDVDALKLKHRCPSCGFEFDKDTSASGRRTETVDKRRAGAAKDADEAAPAPKKGRAKPHKVEDDE